MKTQRIDTSSFGTLHPSQNMSKSLYKAIKNSPVIKSFGDSFNGTISCEPFFSSRNPNKIKYALRVSDLEPLKFLEKLKNKFKFPQNKIDTMLLKTEAVNEEEFAAAIQKEPADSLFKIYNRKK